MRISDNKTEGFLSLMEPNKTQSPRNTATIWERGWLEEGPERYQPGFLVTIFMHRIVIYAHLSHLGSLKALNFFQPCRLCSPWRPICSLFKPLLDWPAPSTGCPQPNHVYTKPEVSCYATRDSPVIQWPMEKWIPEIPIAEEGPTPKTIFPLWTIWIDL